MAVVLAAPTHVDPSLRAHGGRVAFAWTKQSPSGGDHGWLPVAALGRFRELERLAGAGKSGRPDLGRVPPDPRLSCLCGRLRVPAVHSVGGAEAVLGTEARSEPTWEPYQQRRPSKYFAGLSLGGGLLYRRPGQLHCAAHGHVYALAGRADRETLASHRPAHVWAAFGRRAVQ